MWVWEHKRSWAGGKRMWPPSAAHCPRSAGRPADPTWARGNSRRKLHGWIAIISCGPKSRSYMRAQNNTCLPDEQHQWISKQHHKQQERHKTRAWATLWQVALYLWLGSSFWIPSLPRINLGIFWCIQSKGVCVVFVGYWEPRLGLVTNHSLLKIYMMWFSISISI